MNTKPKQVIYITRDEKQIADIAAKVAKETGAACTALIIGTHNAQEYQGKTS